MPPSCATANFNSRLCTAIAPSHSAFQAGKSAAPPAIPDISRQPLWTTVIAPPDVKGRLGHYLFHVDMEGRAGEPAVADALAALGGHCEEVRLLGSYPAA